MQNYTKANYRNMQTKMNSNNNVIIKLKQKSQKGVQCNQRFKTKSGLKPSARKG